MSEPHATAALQDQIIEAVANLESIPAHDLTRLLRLAKPAPIDREQGAVLYGP